MTEPRTVALVRTRNEERNIKRFCTAYDWCDAIIVADGGSTDDTVALAHRFQNVYVRPFDLTVEGKDGQVRNPEGKHVLFLLQEAKAFKPDWVIFDDCDCGPNAMLNREMPDVLRAADVDAYETICAVRLYQFGSDNHFPNLSKPDPAKRTWETSLWAWRFSIGLEPADMDWMLSWPTDFLALRRRLDIWPPLCLVHRPWPDEAALKRKMDLYNASPHGEVALNDPRAWAGPLEPLPAWARE